MKQKTRKLDDGMPLIKERKLKGKCTKLNKGITKSKGLLKYKLQKANLLKTGKHIYDLYTRSHILEHDFGNYFKNSLPPTETKASQLIC